MLRVPAVFKVATLSGSAVATVTLWQAGSYTSTPANAAATTGGSGNGACTLTVTYTGNIIFNAPTGNDFSLSRVANAGAALMAASIPGAATANQFPGLSTLDYLDVGAAQHIVPLFHPGMSGGMSG